MIKGSLFVLTASSLLAATALALPALDFSTNSGTSWTLASADGSNWTLSFTPGSIEVDTANPSTDPVLLDLVDLPTMTLDTINDAGMYLTASLTPVGPAELTITDDTGASGTVMTAAVGTGGSLVIGNTYVAYQMPQDDLDMLSYTPSYSATIEGFEAYDAAGISWDLSFSGQATGGKNLYGMITGGVPDSATGTISGQMSVVVPAPAAVILAGIGICLVGWIKNRRTL